MPAFSKRNPHALSGYESRLSLVGPLPSFQENIFALGTLRRQIAAATFPLAPPFEKRYPFLDIDLLEFLYAVPREQLVRPGQRRSLMRRSLVGVVPEEILDRKRKAYVTRSPRVAISNNWAELKEISEDMVCHSLGIVDSVAFLEALEKARIGDDVPLVPLLRTLTIEYWLRSLKTKQILLEDCDNEQTRSGD
jgi:asparagine synthase (glutamine-hydrolysing)